jgi:hypothetical protein
MACLGPSAVVGLAEAKAILDRYTQGLIAIREALFRLAHVQWLVAATPSSSMWRAIEQLDSATVWLDFNCRDEVGMMVLGMVARAGDEALLDAVIDLCSTLDMRVDCVDWDGMTPLHHAVSAADGKSGTAPS